MQGMHATLVAAALEQPQQLLQQPTTNPLCRKSLPLPIFGGLTRPVLAAEWELGSNWRKVPRLQVGLAVADNVESTVDDGATLSNDGTVAFRKKMFLTRRWGVEVRVLVRALSADSFTAAEAAACVSCQCRPVLTTHAMLTCCLLLHATRHRRLTGACGSALHTMWRLVATLCILT